MEKVNVYIMGVLKKKSQLLRGTFKFFCQISLSLAFLKIVSINTLSILNSFDLFQISSIFPFYKDSSLLHCTLS